MKGFIATFLILLVASQASDLRFLKSTSSSIISTLSKCQHGEIDACIKIASKNFGGSDNAYCASLSTDDDSTEDNYNLYCNIQQSCFKESEGMEGLSVVRVIKEDNYLETIDELETITGQPMLHKIGSGLRRAMMNPGKFEAWACQTWAQLSDLLFNKSIFNADGFVYDTKEKECKLVVKSSEVAATISSSKKFDGVAGSEVAATISSSKKFDGVSGLKSCNVREQDFKFEKLTTWSDLLLTCQMNPKAVECKTVDNFSNYSDPAVCSVLGSDPKVKDCVVSDDVAKKCFNEKNQVNLPAKRVTTGSDAASIQSFLLSLEDGEAIALIAGFNQDGNVEYLGARPKMLIPSIAGEVACRNLLQMTGNYGAPIMDAKKYDMFFYNSADETCSFFLEDDYNKAQEDTEDGRYVEGPAFC